MSISDDGDVALVKRAQQGDAGAYNELVDRHTDRILRLGYVMTRDRHDAEDITQETFVRAYRALKRFENRSQFSSWLYRIAINLCKDRVQARGRGGKNMEEETLEGVAGSDTRRNGPSRRILKAELSNQVQACIERLPRMYRDVFVLRHLQGLEYAEIATVMDLKEEAVRVRAHRAREMLREALGAVVDTFWREKAE